MRASLRSSNVAAHRGFASARAPTVRRGRYSVVRVVAFKEEAPASASDVTIKVSVPYKTAFGQALKVVGSAAPLGAWDVKAALPLDWTSGDIWQGELHLPAGLYEFKVVVVDSAGQALWEPCANRALEVPATPGTLDVPCTWNTPSMATRFTEAPGTTPVDATLPAEGAGEAAAGSNGTVAALEGGAVSEGAAPLVAVLAAAPTSTAILDAPAALETIPPTPTAPTATATEPLPPLDFGGWQPTPTTTAPSNAAPPVVAPAPEPQATVSLPETPTSDAAAAGAPLHAVEVPSPPAAMTAVMGSLEVVAVDIDEAAAAALRDAHAPPPAPPPTPAAVAATAAGVAVPLADAVAVAASAAPEPLPVVAAAAAVAAAMVAVTGEAPSAPAEVVASKEDGESGKSAAAALSSSNGSEAPAPQQQQQQAVLESESKGEANGNGASEPAVPPGLPQGLQELYTSDSPVGKVMRFLYKGL